MVEPQDLIAHYFPKLDVQQLDRLRNLEGLYREHNQNINVISRKDMDNLICNHILHSLSIAKFISFKSEAQILDIGTGGGLPGIPLAIVFPEAQFTLIDGTAKKIRVVNAIVEEIGLDNCRGIHLRAEECKQKFDFVVARAVTRLNKLTNLTLPLIKGKDLHGTPNGLITLKGGDLKEEIKELNGRHYIERQALSEYFEEPFFETKQLLYVQK